MEKEVAVKVKAAMGKDHGPKGGKGSSKKNDPTRRPQRDSEEQR